MPSMNPDGFERAQEGKCDGHDVQSGRTNANGTGKGKSTNDVTPVRGRGQTFVSAIHKLVPPRVCMFRV